MAGWQMARSLLVAESQIASGGDDVAFMQAKIITAQFYAEHLAVQSAGYARQYCGWCCVRDSTRA